MLHKGGADVVNTWNKQTDALTLLDDDFIAAILEQQEREIFARIASLDINENPIEFIEGKVTGGNINIDGDSAVRRTCSLTLVSENVNIHDYYWGLRTKFKLEIGIRNQLDGEYAADSELSYYPDIVWFPQGFFIIVNFNVSLSVNSYQISITGKDKMCMLNGELGGQLFAQIDFGTEEEIKRTFNEVSLEDVTSSDFLEGGKYYKKIRDISDFDDPDEHGILQTNEKYKFAQIQGHWVDMLNATQKYYYKFNNWYKEITEWNRTVNSPTYGRSPLYSAIFEAYELVEKPEDIFIEITSNTYDNSKPVWWKKNGGTIYTNYFEELSGTPVFNLGITYYQLLPIYEEEMIYSIKKLPLRKIITESVHTYAKEPYHNIIINDLERYGLEQLTYKGDKPLIGFYNVNAESYSQLSFFDKIEIDGWKIREGNSGLEFYKESSTKDFSFEYLSAHAVDDNSGSTGDSVYLRVENGHKIWDFNSHSANDIEYRLSIIQFGDDIGYRITDLTYNGDLIANAGETLTSMLDKIKQMLGDFEYFYDIEGHFIFQRKKTFVNVAWSQIVNNSDERYITYANNQEKFSFNFEGNRLITAVQNSPVLSNLKNDFVVWGERTSISGGKIPIHARYAIDKKPTEYMTLRNELYYTEAAIANPSEQYKNEITGESGPSGTFTKNTAIIPQCLIDADPAVAGLATNQEKRAKTKWYELTNWYNYYHYRTGAYPAQQMREYQQLGGFKGTVTFPDNRMQNFTGQLIIDFRKTDINGNATENQDLFIPYYNYNGMQVYPFQHTYNSCQHTYTDFIQRYENYPGMVSYIYNPKLPSQEVIEADGGELRILGTHLVDWRELIYQMALDYFAAQECGESRPVRDKDGNIVLDNPDYFLSTVAELNRDTYPSGITGYEQYYTDMQGFWRQLYNPDYDIEINYESGKYINKVYDAEDGSPYWVKVKTWEPQTVTDINIEYYIDSINSRQYHKLEDWSNDTNRSDHEVIGQLLNQNMKYILNRTNNDAENIKIGWNINIFENPGALNFWIDFLDNGDELQQFSVPLIGDRQKVVTDNKVTAVLFKRIPDLVLYDKETADTNLYAPTENYQNSIREMMEEKTGYTWVFLPQGFAQYCTISTNTLSAKDKIDDLLYQYAYCIENISITALPVYHLQPNTRIYVCDKTTGIAGEYIVHKITLPLTYNGTMSIQASLAPERLY